jgi:hypothetical protein
VDRPWVGGARAKLAQQEAREPSASRNETKMRLPSRPRSRSGLTVWTWAGDRVYLATSATGVGENVKERTLVHGWQKRVLRDGVQAEGQIYDLTRYNGNDFGVKVRVRLPDGSTAKFKKPLLEVRYVGMLAGAGAVDDLRSQILQMAAQSPGGVIDLREGGSSPEDRVAKLKALKDQGLIDDTQFDAARTKILDER